MEERPCPARARIRGVRSRGGQPACGLFPPGGGGGLLPHRVRRGVWARGAPAHAVRHRGGRRERRRRAGLYRLRPAAGHVLRKFARARLFLPLPAGRRLPHGVFFPRAARLPLPRHRRKRPARPALLFLRADALL